MSLSGNGAKIRISPPYCPVGGDFHGPQGFRIGYIWYFCSKDHPTASALDYTARDYTASLPAADFIARFRDAERIAGYCRACPNYGRSWACPPFGFDLEEYLSGYATALIVATKITPAREGLPFSEAGRLIRPERVRHERLLLDMERRYGGRAFAYAGTCLYCPAGECARIAGKPCRHPEWVRPSLEACGFDLCRTTGELLGIPLRWSGDGLLPEYLTLVSGFFHNERTVEWEG